MTIIWCVVPEILSATNRFFVILDHFLPFYPPNNPKNLNFKKMKKWPRDGIILHMCTTNENHMMYGYWDRNVTNRTWQMYNCDFSFWAIFCPFTPINSPKNENFKKKKWKNAWRYHHFTHVHQNPWSNAILFLRYGAWWM